MSISPFVTSSATFLLITNYFLELNFRTKLKKLINNRGLILFLFLFFIPVIFLFNTENIHTGSEIVRIKLSILAIPLIVGTSNFLNKKQINIILLCFIAGIFAQTCLSIITYYNSDEKIINIREIVPGIIGHIRLSLMICMAILIIMYWIYTKTIHKKSLVFLSIILIFWLMYFTAFIEAFTGLSILCINIFCILIYLVYIQKNRMLKKIYFSITTIFTATILIYVAIQIKIFYTPTVQQNQNILTKKGHVYQNDFGSYYLENGNYVFRDICYEELREDWNKRSKIKFIDRDLNNNTISITIIRYLTSKGLAKDAEGLAQLTNTDIKNIEKGESNYKYANSHGLNKRIYTTIHEIDMYIKTGDANGRSLAQRLEYYKIGHLIFLENLWFGTGTGDIRDEYRNMYTKTSSSLLPKYRLEDTHNQFLTFFISFGIIGGIICVLAWFVPVFINSNAKNYYFAVFFITATLAMFSDNTLERIAAVLFVVFFYSIFLWNRKI